MASTDWRAELNGIISGRARATRAEYENSLYEKFLDDVAQPALTAVAEEFKTHPERDAQVRRAPASITLSVRNTETNREEISFRIIKHFVNNGILPSAEIRVDRGQMLTKYDAMLRPDPQTYPISAVTGDDIIGCFIRYYRMGLEGNNAPAEV